MTKPANPRRDVNSSPEVTRLAVIMCRKFPLSLRNLENLLAERGITSATRRPVMRSVHAPAHNHFNQDHHLAEWRTVTA